jgi:hypothetical protein
MFTRNPGSQIVATESGIKKGLGPNNTGFSGFEVPQNNQFIEKPHFRTQSPRV